MKILIFIENDNTYQIYRLPKIVDGNYWITYEDNEGNHKKFLNVFALNGHWVYEDNKQKNIIEYYKTYKIKNIVCFTMPLYDDTMGLYLIKDLDKITFGKTNGDITYNSIDDNQLTLSKKKNNWLIENNNVARNMYINRTVSKGKLLDNGDRIFINGLVVIIFSEFMVINNPLNRLIIKNTKIQLKLIPYVEESLEELDLNSIYEKNDYFYRSPRFRNIIETADIRIDPPPASPIKEELPIMLQMGGMLTMGMSSMVTLIVSISGVTSGEKELKTALPSLIIGVSMLIGMLLIPNLTRRYQKKKTKKQEKLRQEKYLEYLENKKKEIQQVINDQEQSMRANSVSLSQCEDIIIHRRRNLWERKIEHDDFLSVHIGVGEISAKMNVNFPEEYFSLDNDNLRDEVNALANTPRNLKNVPINVSFIEKNICAILGNAQLIPQFLNTILLQLITFHSYEDLKFVILTDTNHSEAWTDFKELPFLWNNDRTLRYYAENKEEKFLILNTLNEEFKQRKYQDEDYSKENNNDYRSYLPYYMIITDDFQSIRDFAFVNNVMKSKINFGFSFLIINQRLMGLPNECNSFINIDANQSGMIENELARDRQIVFQAEFLNKSLHNCYRQVSNVPIEFASKKGKIPESISFLEMYNVGKVEQLNALNRWKTNNSYDTLEAAVGTDVNGSLFMLDLHEKAHGPHGLIAGMTGSGKSEFIITYILSMALNYHPDDVSFVLIDYKGGGLAGAFYNPDTGVRLPHLAGTITNLDTVEIKRSLASIESELKRRQRLFNDARQQTNESTINIYKYQKLYHEGVVSEPIPHLFIISDEFAELKSQQPEFMAQLISTARIGRSLGVHLILATQKPSGVVDAQIWSNSKFRVCLKVQDRSDSMDMIKLPDAAALTTVGRFYLQVGYNEYFAMGQSAWCGAPYYEMDERKIKVDSSLDYINNVGKVVKTIEQENNIKKHEFKGEELPSILSYLSDLAVKENVRTAPLWLPSIQEVIYIANLDKKYSFVAEPYILNEIIGEFDDPSTQSQYKLNLPISKEGNAIIYGSAGSGKENFLTTFIYTTMYHHKPEEVNFYILDFGAETLRIFADAPHVGDVITSDDSDKINNLFKMINNMIDERKKLFMNYGGNYNTFIEKSDKKLPNIIVIINNYDNFKELYPDSEELISSLSREASKFGIYFILTAVGANSVRLKIQQNFKQLLSLQLNNNDDYSSILGNVHKTYPSKKFGRGLVRLNGSIYEFQTAYALEKENLSETLKIFIKEEANKTNYRAKTTPVLPDYVVFKELQENSSINKVIVGLDKNSLELAKYNYKNKPLHIITASEIENLIPFTKGFIESYNSISKNLLFILDGDKNLDNNDINSQYFYQKNLSQVLDSGYNYINKLDQDFKEHKDDSRIEKFTHLTFVIVGLENFLIQIKDSISKFEEMITKGKQLEKLTVIIIDAVDVIKKHEFESWYKENVVINQGIWVGYGITDQFTLKLSKTPKFCYEEISNKFGYIVKSGIPLQVKLLEGDNKHE